MVNYYTHYEERKVDSKEYLVIITRKQNEH